MLGFPPRLPYDAANPLGFVTVAQLNDPAQYDALLFEPLEFDPLEFGPLDQAVVLSLLGWTQATLDDLAALLAGGGGGGTTPPAPGYTLANGTLTQRVGGYDWTIRGFPSSFNAQYQTIYLDGRGTHATTGAAPPSSDGLMRIRLVTDPASPYDLGDAPARPVQATGSDFGELTFQTPNPGPVGAVWYFRLMNADGVAWTFGAPITVTA